MAYNPQLLDRVREALYDMGTTDFIEKRMFGGVVFMVRNKMCVGIMKDEIMCRIGADHQNKVSELPGCRPMDFTGRPMKGYVFVSEDVIQKKKDLEFWLKLCLDFNSVLEPK